MLGDPTIFGNLLPCDEMIDAMINSLQSQRNNGYFPAVGSEEARRAIAEYCSVPEAEVEWTVCKFEITSPYMIRPLFLK